MKQNLHPTNTQHSLFVIRCRLLLTLSVRNSHTNPFKKSKRSKRGNQAETYRSTKRNGNNGKLQGWTGQDDIFDFMFMWEDINMVRDYDPACVQFESLNTRSVRGRPQFKYHTLAWDINFHNTYLNQKPSGVGEFWVSFQSTQHGDDDRKRDIRLDQAYRFLRATMPSLLVVGILILVLSFRVVSGHTSWLMSDKAGKDPVQCSRICKLDIASTQTKWRIVDIE